LSQLETQVFTLDWILINSPFPMKNLNLLRLPSLVVFLLLFYTISGFAQNLSPAQKNLIQLDAAFEQAQLDFDLEFFKNTLATDFIWVHNHASLVDDKAAVLKRTAQPNTNTRSRVSRDVKAIILEKTGIVTGITVVDRGPSPVTYHFMRTYVAVDGKWLLFANHTMAIPDEEVKK